MLTHPPGWLDGSLALLLCAFAALTWRALRRPESGPTLWWVAGWAAAGISILAYFAGRELPLVHVLSFPFATAFAAFTLAGALRLAERPLPSWILPMALAFGALRAGLAALGDVEVAYLVAVPVEPLVVLAAGWVAHRARPEIGAASSQLLLGPAFIVLAAAGAVHLVWMAQGKGVSPQLFGLWLLVGPPVLGLQLRAGSHQGRQELARAYAGLERRVEERTAELARANVALEREVDERRNVEQSLRVSNERHRMLAELGSDYGFAFRIERDGTFHDEWASGARERITGYGPGDLEGNGWLSIVHPDDLEGATRQFREVRAGRAPAVEHRIIRRDGAIRWLHVECAVERSEAGIRVVGAARDVTDLKEAEAERRRFEQHAQELQRLESLGILAGGIAHDFNNLLSVIAGNARLTQDLLSGEISPAARRHLEARLQRIREASDKASSLTEQMLTYAGRSSVALRPLDLSPLAAGMEDLLGASVPESCVLESQLADDLPLVEADEGQIHQVLLNLVMNAVEAVGPQPGRIGLRTGRVEVGSADLEGAFGTPDAKPGEYVFLEVSDDGCGMDAETSLRIFEPFFTTKRSGRGLGMAATLGIVHKHHGVVQLRSEAGVGTTLRVLLPAATGALAIVSEPRPSRAPAARGATILIADDDALVLELGREFLLREGFEVVSASGGRAAVEALRAQPHAIDAAVLDIAMPDLDGEKTLTELRAIRPDLPVVFVTGHDRESAEQRFAEHGVHHLLRKPYEPEDLAQRLREAMAGDAASESGDSAASPPASPG